LGLSFWLATLSYIRSGIPNPFVGYSLPMSLLGATCIEITVGLVQLPFVYRALRSEVPLWRICVGWMLGTIVGLATAFGVRDLIFGIDIFSNFDAPSTIILDYLMGTRSGALGGLIGGSLMGIIQVCSLPIRKIWIVLNAVAWSIGWAMGWVVMRYASLAAYYGAFFVPDSDSVIEPQGFVLALEQKLAIYGIVLGLVSSTITGIGLLMCYRRRSAISYPNKIG
jgi:hypothetical protein